MTRSEWIHRTAMRMLAADPELDADFVASACVEVASAIDEQAPFAYEAPVRGASTPLSSDCRKR